MLNILRPKVRSSIGCLLKAHSSCCALGDVLDPEDIRRAGHLCVGGGKQKDRVQQYTPVLSRASHPGHRKTGPLAGGSWSKPLVWWLFLHHKSLNTVGRCGKRAKEF